MHAQQGLTPLPISNPLGRRDKRFKRASLTAQCTKSAFVRIRVVWILVGELHIPEEAYDCRAKWALMFVPATMKVEAIVVLTRYGTDVYVVRLEDQARKLKRGSQKQRMGEKTYTENHCRRLCRRKFHIVEQLESLPDKQQLARLYRRNGPISVVPLKGF